MESLTVDPLAGRRAAVGLAAGFVLFVIFAFAGGIGVPLALLAAALIALPAPALWRRLSPPRPALALALGFLIWATLTLAWSPASPEQIAKTWLIVLFGAGLILAAASLPERLRAGPRLALIAAMLVLSVALAAEGTTGGAVTAMAKGLEPDHDRVLSMLGRGSAAAMIMLAPACALVLQKGGRWILAAFVMFAGVLAVSIRAEIQANQMALAIALAAFVVAWFAPRGAILAFAVLFPLWLILFPFGVMVMDPLIQPRRADMPFSWEWRWEAWRTAVDLIDDRPLLGQGVDSTRHFRDLTTEMRGFELSRIPLHTHSASLQIWLELGLAGIALACAAITLCARRLAGAAPDRPQAAAIVGTAVAAAFVFSTSYGFWQEWLWCSAVLAAAACMIVGRGPDARPA